MKVFLLLPLFAIVGISDYNAIHFPSKFQDDTIKISHLLDGDISEWPAEKFTTDEITKVRHSVDNDNQTLFLVISISDKTIQQKIVQQGMKLFLDTKNKRKENQGIEFPVKIESSSPDFNTMKLFGFSSIEPFSQNIKTEGTANIAAAWDSLNILNIEYNIPMTILGDIQELKNKKISIGWKWKEEEFAENKTSTPTPNSGYTATTIVGVPAGSRSNNRPPVQTSIPNRVVDPTPRTGKAQSVWSAYTITL